MKVCDLVPDIHFANIILKTYQIDSIIIQDPNGKNKSQYFRSLYEQSKSKKGFQQQKDSSALLQNCKKTILIALKAYDETAATSVLLTSNQFIDMPFEQLDQTQFQKDEGYHLKYINDIVQSIKPGSVLSFENASSILVNNSVNFGLTPN